MGIVVAFFQILSLSVCAVLSVQRAFAISGRDWRPASIALALGLVPIGTNIFGYVKSSWSVTTIPIVGSACEEILALLVLGSSYKSTCFGNVLEQWNFLHAYALLHLTRLSSLLPGITLFPFSNSLIARVKKHHSWRSY
ncbi:hypothetical protein AcV7_003942 [Taiwanofungus camphoratus]|nr:hypothetical protein AcV7_003942 [Antrodia cinnamomea]